MQLETKIAVIKFMQRFQEMEVPVPKFRFIFKSSYQVENFRMRLKGAD